MSRKFLSLLAASMLSANVTFAATYSYEVVVEPVRFHVALWGFGTDPRLGDLPICDYDSKSGEYFCSGSGNLFELTAIPDFEITRFGWSFVEENFDQIFSSRGTISLREEIGWHSMYGESQWVAECTGALVHLCWDFIEFTPVADPNDIEIWMRDMGSVAASLNASAGTYRVAADSNGWAFSLGDASLFGEAGYNIDYQVLSVRQIPSEVPLPASGLFLLAGLGGLALAKKRRAT